MAEWLKAHDSKLCGRQRLEGSNPSLSAIKGTVKRNIRWIIYVLIGGIFGVADFFIEASARQILTYPWLLLVGLIWIVPSSLVALYEVKKSGLRLRTVSASVLVWTVGVVSYYVLYATVLLSDEMIISIDWAQFVLDIVIWCVAGAVGGLVVGLLVEKVFRKKGAEAKELDK